MKNKYVCQKCGLTWDQQERKDPAQCFRCHEWVHPVGAAAKEKK